MEEVDQVSRQLCKICGKMFCGHTPFERGEYDLIDPRLAALYRDAEQAARQAECREEPEDERTSEVRQMLLKLVESASPALITAMEATGQGIMLGDVTISVAPAESHFCYHVADGCSFGGGVIAATSIDIDGAVKLLVTWTGATPEYIMERWLKWAGVAIRLHYGVG